MKHLLLLITTITLFNCVQSPNEPTIDTETFPYGLDLSYDEDSMPWAELCELSCPQTINFTKHLADRGGDIFSYWFTVTVWDYDSDTQQTMNTSHFSHCIEVENMILSIDKECINYYFDDYAEIPLLFTYHIEYYKEGAVQP